MSKKYEATLIQSCGGLQRPLLASYRYNSTVLQCVFVCFVFVFFFTSADGCECRTMGPKAANVVVVVAVCVAAVLRVTECPQWD